MDKTLHQEQIIEGMSEIPEALGELEKIVLPSALNNRLQKKRIMLDQMGEDVKQ